MMPHLSGTRRVLCALLAASCACAAVVAPAAAQPLQYTQTDFIHGFASESGIWTAGYRDLGTSPRDYVSARVPIGPVGLPSFPVTTRYAQQLRTNADSVYVQAGRHVLVGHSLGGLVARGTYLGLPGVPSERAADVRAGVAGIITLASPHQGAVIADSIQKAKGFLLDLQRRVNDGLGAARIWAFLYGANKAGPFGSLVLGLFVDQKTAGNDIDVSAIAGLATVPALLDLRTQSEAIASLNARTDDAAIPRANITGRIPVKHALLRLRASLDDGSEEAAIQRRNDAMLLFKVCKYTGYSIIYLARQARRCGFAIRMLDRVDETWARYTLGTEWRAGRQVARNVGFDGVAPNERSRYPGLSDNRFDRLPVDGLTHQSIYKKRLGLDQVVNAMQLFEMQGAQPAPPRRALPAEPLRVAVSGPMSLYVGAYGSWWATVTGGVPPYSYAWNPDVQGDGAYASAVFSSPGWYYATLTVTDAAGSQTSGGVGVSVEECMDPFSCWAAQRVGQMSKAGSGRAPAPRGSRP